MSIQAHDSIGSSPYELVFGQKAHTVLFPSGKNNRIPLLEDDEMLYGDHVPQEDGKPEETEDRKRQWDKDGSEEEGEVTEKKRWLQDGDQETVRARQLATTKKHLKVRVSIFIILRGILYYYVVCLKQQADKKYLKTAKKDGRQVQYQEESSKFQSWGDCLREGSLYQQDKLGPTSPSLYCCEG